MANFTLWNRLSRINGGTNLLPGDNSDLVDTSQGLSQLQGLKDLTNTGAGKFAAGTGTLVTGAVIIATGLTSVTSFQATLIGPATGASGAQIIQTTSITTGAVTVGGFFASTVTGSMVAATTATGAFFWMAYGT
jgi:hypothetical protein